MTVLKPVLGVIVRKALHGRRKNHLLFLLLTLLLLIWYSCSWLAIVTSQALLPPPPVQRLEHFRRNKTLEHYLKNIQLLIEPSSSPCSTAEEVPVIILVASTPHHFEARQAVRDTWAKHFLTYFVLGLYGNEVDEQLVDNYIEAKLHSDLVIYDFRDEYANLTLKSALMMDWTLQRCPLAQFLFKTDDDVLVNPWTFNNVLKEHRDDKLVGYKRLDSVVHRDEYTKWHIPRWLYTQDTVPQYLAGAGYLVSGDYLEKILKQAHKVPLVNLEDVYFTYLVAYKSLGFSLTHDKRLSPFKPWVSFGCAYWSRAIVQGLTPDEMRNAWTKIQQIAKENEGCYYFNKYIDSEFLLY